MINISIYTGNFPDNLKIAKLIPIHKRGAKYDPSNYRRISILSAVLIKVKSLNLKKAFYIVNHELLIKNLDIYKFDMVTLNWMNSYLSDRKQDIISKQNQSSLHTVKAGVPKGSVLGPVLFLLFVNDLPLFINEAAWYVDFYVDDSTVHSSYKQLNAVHDDLQVGSGNLKDCCFKNDMRIHLKKISVTTIVSRQALTKIDSLNILLDNELMQIDAVCLNVSRRFTLLKLLSKYVDLKSLNNITTAIFCLYLMSYLGSMLSF